MSKLFRLSDNDFYLGKGTRGNLVFNKIKDTSSIVLFYSPSCEYCKPFLDLLRVLSNSKTTSNCVYGQIMIDSRSQVVKMSNETLNPIKSVPLLIYYHKGRPFMQYNGDPDLNQLQMFISDTTKKITNTSFTETKLKDKIQEYKPRQVTLKFEGDSLKCKDGVCYLTQNDSSQMMNRR